jgi:catechol 2,3-dioxygenase-like lactoylglutathione lyase family enzyme
MSLSRVAKFAAILLVLTFWGFIAATSGSQSDYQDSESLLDEDENMAKSITANLMVSDMTETIAFYHDVLGFEIVMTQPESGPYDWAMMQSGGAQLMFQTIDSLGDELPEISERPLGGSFTLFMVVPDVSSINDLLPDNVHIVKELHQTFYGMLEVTIKDPDGYIITIAQEVTE